MIMRKLLFIMLLLLTFASCGVGVYSVSSGKADVALLSFSAPTKEKLVVKIGEQQYQIQTVKIKAYKADRKIKQTALNSIRLQAGQHHVIVMYENGNVVFEKKIVLSASEHRIIEL